jgi:hypothetical protein
MQISQYRKDGRRHRTLIEFQSLLKMLNCSFSISSLKMYPIVKEMRKRKREGESVQGKRERNVEISREDISVPEIFMC